MKTYTFSEARQNLDVVLESARGHGAVRIRREDGQNFVLTPEVRTTSPLNVQGVDLDVTTDELVAFVREGRRELP